MIHDNNFSTSLDLLESIVCYSGKFCCSCDDFVYGLGHVAKCLSICATGENMCTVTDYELYVLRVTMDISLTMSLSE